MYHAAMVPLTHVSPLRAYFPTYIMRRFELEPFLSHVSRYHISELIVVPPVALAIIKTPSASKYSFENLKWVGCGAAPLALENQLALQKVLGPQTIVVQGWGMTETCCIAMRFVGHERDDTGSVGRPMYNLDLKLVKTHTPLCSMSLTPLAQDSLTMKIKISQRTIQGENSASEVHR